MTDPAIEAANRAWMDRYSGVTTVTESALAGGVGDLAIGAAREALKPIRDLLDKLALDTYPPCDLGTRIDLFQQAISDLSPLVYTSEELKAGP